MGKKPVVSVTYENEGFQKKKQLTLHKMCVTSLPCGPWAHLPLYREKTVYSTTHKTAINRPMDHKGEM